MTFKALTLAGIAASLFAIPASAHHSFAMFDHNITTTVTGTVKEFEWINPHSWIHVTAMDANGKPVTWSFEAGSTGQLMTAGWKRDDIKVGDKIALGFHPLKDGSHGGQVLTVTTADGRKLAQGRDARAE
jgi:hypothetical protein